MKKLTIAIMIIFMTSFCLMAEVQHIAVNITGVSFESGRLNISTTEGQYRFNFHDDPLLLEKAKGYQANALLAMALNLRVGIYYITPETEKLIVGFNVVK